MTQMGADRGASECGKVELGRQELRKGRRSLTTDYTDERGWTGIPRRFRASVHGSGRKMRLAGTLALPFLSAFIRGIRGYILRIAELGRVLGRGGFAHGPHSRHIRRVFFATDATRTGHGRDTDGCGGRAVGGSPGGTGIAPGANKEWPFAKRRRALSVGGSPTGTGGSPVLPFPERALRALLSVASTALLSWWVSDSIPASLAG